MNKIHNAFENKKAFIGFLTAGDPTFEDSFNNIMAMVKGGADLIEIGIPFSDPIAEGPVIQDANIRALSHGMTTDRAFELAEKVRQNTDIIYVTPNKTKAKNSDIGSSTSKIGRASYRERV